MGDAQPPAEATLSGAEELIERAIDSVLEQVPDVVADDEPEGSAKLQPWAETAAPPSKNKRPLAELLEQYAERVREDPEAVAGRPRGQHPVAAFFARFAPVGAGRDSGAGSGRGVAGAGRGGRRGAGRGGAGDRVAAANRGAAVAGGPVAGGDLAQTAGAGRRRRGRRGRGGAGGGVPEAATPVPTGEQPSGGRSRRRRGRGGRGGGGGEQASRPIAQQPRADGAAEGAPGGRRRSRSRGRRRGGGGGEGSPSPAE